MTGPFETSRPRRLSTVLDPLRARRDAGRFDAVVFALEAVAVDPARDDMRALPGSLAWIDELHALGKRCALLLTRADADAGPRLAGVRRRFEATVPGPRAAETFAAALDELRADAGRAIAVDAIPAGIRAAREAGFATTIAVARGDATPEALRAAGADAVVADLQELLGTARS